MTEVRREMNEALDRNGRTPRSFSSARAAAIRLSSLCAQNRAASVTLSSKSLATWYWLMTVPTRTPIASAPLSLPASTRALTLSKLRSVAASRSSRLCGSKLGQRPLATHQHAARNVGRSNLQSYIPVL